jgi:hypothetical protein
MTLADTVAEAQTVAPRSSADSATAVRSSRRR